MSMSPQIKSTTGQIALDNIYLLSDLSLKIIGAMSQAMADFNDIVRISVLIMKFGYCTLTSFAI